MNIVTRIVKTPTTAYRAGWPVYHIKERLVAAGWTVAGSSNGSAGGMDGVDRITSGASFGTANTSWLVLQSPHPVAANRVQLKFRLTATTDNSAYLEVSYDPSAAYASVSTTDPTSATGVVLHTGLIATTNNDLLVTILADTDPPYGWAALLSFPGSTTMGGSGAIVFCPLDTVGLVNPGKPYVVLYGRNNGIYAYGNYEALNYFYMTQGYITNAYITLKTVAEPRDPPKAPVVVNALLFQDSDGLLIRNMTPKANKSIETTPIVFQHLNEFIGTTTFMRWMGGWRHRLTTWGDVNGPKRWILFDDVCLPWDGTTTPVFDLSAYNVPL